MQLQSRDRSKKSDSYFRGEIAEMNSTTRFVCISDNHDNYDFILPDGEILLELKLKVKLKHLSIG